MLERDGLAGFTHRAIAGEAGVPAASVAYHFDGMDDLAVSAILEATDTFVASVRAHADGRSISAYADALAAELREHRGRVIAGYELYLLAARRPALREAATAWLRAGAEPLLTGVGAVPQQVFLAVVESVCLHALLEDRPPTGAEIETLLRQSLR